MLDDDKLVQFRTALDKEKQRLEKEIGDIGKGGISKRLTNSTGELSAYDNHPADLGSESFERGKDIALRENARMALKKIEEAYERMADGSYGICQQCRVDIPAERLEVLPYASLCHACKEKEEENAKNQKPEGRPVEEDTLEPPFMRSDQDDEDSTTYDGEDAFQEGAKYGTSSSPQDEPPSRTTSRAHTNSDEPTGTVTELEDLIDPNGEKEFIKVERKVDADLKNRKKRKN